MLAYTGMRSAPNGAAATAARNGAAASATNELWNAAATFSFVFEIFLAVNAFDARSISAFAPESTI